MSLTKVAAFGATFDAPDGWQVETVDEQVAVVLEPDDGEESFRANLVLTVEDTAGVSFRDWQVGTDADLPTVLADYLLLDLAVLTVGGHPGGRRLAHHMAADGPALVMEQWFTQVDGLGYTLTATIDAPRYAQAAAVLDECAASLRIEGPR